MANTLLSNIVAPSAIVTLTGTQTLTNKTLTSPTMTTPTLGVASATSIELGHATDTTLARSAAGVVTIEGVEVVTLSRSQTLTNKSLTSPVVTGTLTAGGTTGTNGQLLASTGSGLQWVTRDVSTLDSLTDVTISSATSGQVLTFTGSAWINADSDAVIASAVFATNAQSDLGSVADAIVAAEEDLGFITDVAALIYDMGQLRLDGIVSLNNIDQSVKADYIGYSIIFGF
jgi:hypothetical protein